MLRLKRSAVSANDIYYSAPVKNEFWAQDSGMLSCHMDVLACDDEGFEANNRVKVKIHFDYVFDGRRCMVLFSVWLDELPFMLCQNAGREGRDHLASWITNKERYFEADAYLRSLKKPQTLDTTVIAPEQDNDDYVCFYGNMISEDFRNIGEVEYHKPTIEEVQEYVLHEERVDGTFTLRIAGEEIGVFASLSESCAEVESLWHEQNQDDKLFNGFAFFQDGRVKWFYIREELSSQEWPSQEWA